MSGFTIEKVLWQASSALQSLTDQSVLEASLLLGKVMNMSRSLLLAFPEKLLTISQYTSYQRLIHRRALGEPIAYLLRAQAFWSLDLTVSPKTLIPRPETELLVETVLALFDKHSKITVADLGTGSGAIALALAYERSHWQITATDHSLAALKIAKQNAKKYNSTHVTFSKGNWYEALYRHDFDVIVSNPPYLSEAEWPKYMENLQFEPEDALVSGKDGLEAIRQLIQGAPQHLKLGGFLILEHGFLQGEKVRAIFNQFGYQGVHSIKDLNGHERVTVGNL